MPRKKREEQSKITMLGNRLAPRFPLKRLRNVSARYVVGIHHARKRKKTGIDCEGTSIGERKVTIPIKTLPRALAVSPFFAETPKKAPKPVSERAPRGSNGNKVRPRRRGKPNSRLPTI